MNMLNVKEINKLVVQYFEGVLMHLKLNYISNRVYKITVSYMCDQCYACEYQIELDDSNDVITCCHHTCYCQLERINLFQEREFEERLLDLFKII